MSSQMPLFVGTKTKVTSLQICPCSIAVGLKDSRPRSCPLRSIILSSQTAAVPMTMMSMRFLTPNLGCR